MSEYEMRVLERLARETVGGVCGALDRIRYPYNKETAEEITAVICDGIVEALCSGDNERLPYQVAEQQSKVEIEGELPPGEPNSYSFWNTLARFADQVEAEGYLRYRKQESPGKSYRIFVKGIPVDYEE